MLYRLHCLPSSTAISAGPCISVVNNWVIFLHYLYIRGIQPFLRYLYSVDVAYRSIQRRHAFAGEADALRKGKTGGRGRHARGKSVLNGCRQANS